MPYKINLTLVDGERLQQPDIHHESTPNVGDKIVVNVGNGATRAEVTGVHKYQSMSPGTAVETVDDVDAQEL